MLGIQNYYSFLLAVLVFQLIPGAGTIAILHQTARNGKGGGTAAVLGTLTGDFIFMLAAMAGLAAVLNAHPILFKSLQWFGVVYLCWFGIQFLRVKPSSSTHNVHHKQSLWVSYRKACMVSLTNPKVILFFVSFFPLFLSPDASALTLVILVTHVMIISFCYQMLLVILGNQVASLFKKCPSANRLAQKIAGITLIGFSVKLGLANAEG